MFGYYPLLDRSGGGGSAGPVRRPYYFQVALQESLELSGIPEYLRILAKPIAVRRAPARMFTAEPISPPPTRPTRPRALGYMGLRRMQIRQARRCGRVSQP